METKQNETKKMDEEKSFSTSDLVLQNRRLLSITGVEKVYETSEMKLQIKVSGTNLVVCGENLGVTKLDVESGILEVSGVVNEIKYLNETQKQGIFKKLFK